MKDRREDSRTDAADASGGNLPVAGKRTLLEQTYGAVPTRVANAPVQRKANHAPSPTQPFNAVLKVVAYHGSKVVKVWGAKGHWEGPLPQTYEGTNEKHAWKWNNAAEAHTIRVNANANGEGGESLDTWGTQLGADRIVVYAKPLDAITVDANKSANDDKAPGHAIDTKDAGDGSSDDVNPGSVKHTGGNRHTAPQGTGTYETAASSDGTGTEHRDGKERGGDQGTPDDAAQSGDSGQSDHNGNSTRTVNGTDGGTVGSTHTEGSTVGDHRSDSDKRSLVHNENAEKGDAADANIPEDGAKAGGRAGGDANKGDGGAVGGMAFWKLISVPAAIGPLVDMGLLLDQAGISSVADGIVLKAEEGVEGAALRAAIEEDVDHYASRELAGVESEFRHSPEWQQLDDAARAEKTAELKQALKEGAMDKLDAQLDQRIDELESEIQNAKQVADSDVGEALGEQAKADLKATEESLNEAKAVEEKAAKVAKKKKNLTRGGYKRTNAADWRKTMKSWDAAGYGDVLSEENRALIKAGKVPHVDDQWIEHFPGDAPLKGEPISMHHIGGGKLTVPLPKTRHMDAHMPGGTSVNPGGPGMTGSVEANPDGDRAA